MAKKIALKSNTSKDKATVNTAAEAFFPVFKENTFAYNCKKIIKKKKVNNNWKLIELHQALFVFKDKQPPDFLV